METGDADLGRRAIDALRGGAKFVRNDDGSVRLFLDDEPKTVRKEDITAALCLAQAAKNTSSTTPLPTNEQRIQEPDIKPLQAQNELLWKVIGVGVLGSMCFILTVASIENNSRPVIIFKGPDTPTVDPLATPTTEVLTVEVSPSATVVTNETPTLLPTHTSTPEAPTATGTATPMPTYLPTVRYQADIDFLHQTEEAQKNDHSFEHLGVLVPIIGVSILYLGVRGIKAVVSRNKKASG